MTQPLGFEQQDSTIVCKLNKALYGHKPAPKAWYRKLTQALVHFGFIHNKCDHYVFTYSN